MTKILAITPSFAAWRRAADRLLALETASALSKRATMLSTFPVSEPVPGPVDEREIQQVRMLASELFEVARAEAELARHA